MESSHRVLGALAPLDPIRLVALSAPGMDVGKAVVSAAACCVQLAVAHRPAALVSAIKEERVSAFVVLPPLSTLECFPIALALRRMAPAIPVAIACGESRMRGGAPRVLWLSTSDVRWELRTAVDEVAVIHASEWIEVKRDSTTSDLDPALVDDAIGTFLEHEVQLSGDQPPCVDRSAVPSNPEPRRTR